MKIGFIDYYLDEWHANHYPQWFKEVDSQAEVAFGYAVLDNPNGRTNRQWCEDNGVTLCATMEELVEKSDALAVLSPDNTELHEALCQVALRSGKRTYIDKTRMKSLAGGFSTWPLPTTPPAGPPLPCALPQSTRTLTGRKSRALCPWALLGLRPISSTSWSL